MDMVSILVLGGVGLLTLHVVCAAFGRPLFGGPDSGAWVVIDGSGDSDGGGDGGDGGGGD